MTTIKAPANTRPKPLTMRALREQVRAAELEVALAEAKYTKRLLTTLIEADEVVDTERAGWDIVASAGRTIDMKDLTGPGIETDLPTVRKRSYRAWRLDPHGRGILRNLLRFVVGRELTLDFGDTKRGVWANGVPGGEVSETGKEDDRLLTRLVWDEFSRRNAWKLRIKELVRRTFRDGDMFLRRFVRDGHVAVRFIEPDAVATPTNKTGGAVQDTDIPLEAWPLTSDDVGKKTRIIDGVEVLASDVETVVAYHVRQGDVSAVDNFERVPAKDVIHLKCSADLNDARGVPFLEPILKKLSQYDTWEEYRIILNKIRTSIALVRKIEGGTAAQAQAIIAGRQPAPGAPLGRDPQTTSGRREAAFRPGTILTPSAGVSYDFISPRLDARDASEDGRKLLLTIAVGAGMPEMLVTGDFCHHIDTEVLSDRGWLKFDDVSYGDHLATVNPATGFLEYQKPFDLHSFHYRGEMFACRERKVRFCVTPNHELWVAPVRPWRQSVRHQASGEPLAFEKICAKDLSRSHYAIQMAVKDPNREDQASYRLPWGETMDMDVWLRFLGYVISEGHILKRQRDVPVGIVLTQKQGTSVEAKISSCMSSLPWVFHKSTASYVTWKSVHTKWRSCNRRLAQHVREIVGSEEGALSWQKRLPDFVWGLSWRQKQLFLDALLDGDGSRYPTCAYYATSSPRLADDVHRLGVLLGYNATLSLTKKHTAGPVVTKHQITHVVLSRGHPRMLELSRIVRESHDGRVWCATVPNGLLVTRFEGRVLVSGNSNANFASTSVAAQLVQREWEDWQDFFEGALVKVYEWVLEAAVEALGLPVNTDRSLSLQWPVFLRDDEAKATERRVTLWQSGILSKRTWAAEEGYVYDDEKELMVDEDPPDMAVAPGAGDDSGSMQEARIQAAHAALLALGELDEAAAKVQDQEVAGALGRYVDRARNLLLAEQKSPTKVQSLIFDKTKFDAKRARKWARVHGFHATKADETEGSIRLRQVDPERFKDGSIKTITLTKGVKATVGHPK